MSHNFSSHVDKAAALERARQYMESEMFPYVVILSSGTYYVEPDDGYMLRSWEREVARFAPGSPPVIQDEE